MEKIRRNILTLVRFKGVFLLLFYFMAQPSSYAGRIPFQVVGLIVESIGTIRTPDLNVESVIADLYTQIRQINNAADLSDHTKDRLISALQYLFCRTQGKKKGMKEKENCEPGTVEQQEYNEDLLVLINDVLKWVKETPSREDLQDILQTAESTFEETKKLNGKKPCSESFIVSTFFGSTEERRGENFRARIHSTVELVRASGGKVEEVHIPSAGGALAGHFYVPSPSVVEGGDRDARPRPKKTVLLLSGTVLPNEVQTREIIRFLLNNGISVLAADYRGYGASSPIMPHESSIYEDADNMYNFLRKIKNVPAADIIPWGYSMGAAAASYVAGKNREDLPTLILDRPLKDRRDAIKANLPFVLRPLSGRIGMSSIGQLDTQGNTQKYLQDANTNKNVLVMTAGADVLAAQGQNMGQTLKQNLRSSHTIQNVIAEGKDVKHWSNEKILKARCQEILTILGVIPTGLSAATSTRLNPDLHHCEDF